MKKKKHILRNTLIIVGSVIAILLSAIGITICDFTDNTPSYVAAVEKESVGDYLSAKVKKSLLESGLVGDFEFLFSEQEINELLATIVPSISIPMVGIRSAYVDIGEDDSIALEAPFWAMFYHCCAKANGLLSYDSTTITLKLETIKVGLLESGHGIVDAVLNEDMVKNIQDSVNDVGVCLSVSKKEKQFYVTMTNIDICKTIVNCTKTGVGFLSAALLAGTLTAKTTEIVVNQNGKSGIIIHRGLLKTESED